MAVKHVPTLDESGKIFDKHLPERLSPENIQAKTLTPDPEHPGFYLIGE
ncbi:hypothetical protein [Paenarthrobacter sp. C1]